MATPCLSCFSQQCALPSHSVLQSVLSSKSRVSTSRGFRRQSLSSVASKGHRAVAVCSSRDNAGGVLEGHSRESVDSGKQTEQQALPSISQKDAEATLDSPPSPLSWGQRAALWSLLLLQTLAPLPLGPSTSPLEMAPPAQAVLNSPDTKIPRNPEIALRRAIPAVNPTLRSVQESLEEIFYLLRIPQRKPYGTMQSNVEKAIKLSETNKASILAAVPADNAAVGEALVKELLTGKNGLPGLLDAIAAKDADKVSIRLANSLNTLGELALIQAPGLPFLIPPQYASLPRLTGRATVEIVLEKTGDELFIPSAGGGGQKTATLELVVDGYSAPLTSGNFISLVEKKAYDGLKFRATEFAVLSENVPGVGLEVPLEVKPAGDFQPIYRTPLDVQEGELPVLPMSVFGAVVMSRSGESEALSAPNQFFFYKYDKRNSGLGGLSFDEGQFAVFGYVTKGREILSQVRTGDVIKEAKVVSGADRLVLP